MLNRFGALALVTGTERRNFFKKYSEIEGFIRKAAETGWYSVCVHYLYPKTGWERGVATFTKKLNALGFKVENRGSVGSHPSYYILYISWDTHPSVW